MVVDLRKQAKERAKKPDEGTQITTADSQYVDDLLSHAWDGVTGGAFGRQKARQALLEIEAWLKKVPEPATGSDTA